MIPTSAHLLGTATELNVTVASGGVPTAIAVVLAAQVGAFAGSASMVTLAADGAMHVAAVLLLPADFNDQPITGSTTYANPIAVALAETGGSGHTVLTINGVPAGTSATLTGSNQSLGVSYDGGGAIGYYATVTLSAAGATSASFDVVPIYVSTSSQYYTAGALTFNGSLQSASFSVNEAVGSNTYANSAPSSGCSGVATSAGSGASGTVIFTSANAAASPCALQITDSLGGTYAVPYTTTTSSGGVTVGGVTEYATAHGSPFAITAGPDGNLWVMENNSIEKLTTAGAEAASYGVGNSIGAITPGTNGNLYFVYGYASLSEITTAGATNSVSTGTYALNGIAQDAQGDLWVVDQFDGIVEEFSSESAVAGELLRRCAARIGHCARKRWPALFAGRRERDDLHLYARLRLVANVSACRWVHGAAADRERSEGRQSLHQLRRLELDRAIADQWHAGQLHDRSGR